MSARHRLPLPVAAVLFGLTACASTPAPAPLPAAPLPASPAVTTKPSEPAATPKPSASAATPKPSASAANQTASGVECPSARTLETLVDLPRGWHFNPSSVECWKGWATADPEGPTAGDGIYLFRHKAGTGWKYHSQGSGYDCEDLGIHEAAPFCQYP